MNNVPCVSLLAERRNLRATHSSFTRSPGVLAAAFVAIRRFVLTRARKKSTLASAKVVWLTRSRECRNLDRALTWAERHSRESGAGYAVVVFDLRSA